MPSRVSQSVRYSWLVSLAATVGYGVAAEELGHAPRHGLRTLHVQQVGDTPDRAVLDLRKPGVEQLLAVHEPLIGLRAQYREHRLRDGRCLLGSEPPCAEGRQVAAKKAVGVLHRLRHAAGDVLLDYRLAGRPVEAKRHAHELRHCPLTVTQAVRRQRWSRLHEEGTRARSARQRWLKKGQCVDDFGTVDSQLEGDDRPGGVAGNMRAMDTEMAEQRRGVGCMFREAHRQGALRAADLS